MDGENTRRMDRLEAVLRAAHAGRDIPAPDQAMVASVLAAIKAAPPAEPANGILWRMAAGAGFLAAAMVLFALVFGSGFEEEIGRALFYDPNGQVLVSMLGV
ncbi:hypothetical protein DFW101_2351 [Solidesulfovibrio carbinoliphilus subsp. oakridgensis]|uniref:Uncharacterized protein n=1 Tax=Solidesulfovibrio carbinoliphilus subsp. oakridgensis TaxID=694327 RepID=G7QB14_9BACT|nr:hypothetical protein [Solidesulfovibrio carbinoliphilus]EHJ48355.1 hypothetical protein DFW101_2351 [Solidesulfovibrio carbinoliphilus subsp. oakridgensis]